MKKKYRIKFFKGYVEFFLINEIGETIGEVGFYNPITKQYNKNLTNI